MNKFLTALFFLLIISGCSNDASQEPANKDPKKNLPPKVQIEIEDTVYSAEQGSFCWRNANSTNCLSLPFPTEILEYVEPIIVTKKGTINLLIERQPSQQTLTILNVEFNQAEEIPINKNNKFKAPATEGTYILDYYAIWEKDHSGTSGDSSFVFKIEVK